MKSLRFLTIVATLLMVFGTSAPSARADDKAALAHAPSHLRLNAYNGDPKKDTPEKFEFQLNTIDPRRPSEFLKLGETVSRTKWKLAKFEYKTRTNAQTSESEDISELTIVNTETGQEIVLILNRLTDLAVPAPKK